MRRQKLTTFMVVTIFAMFVSSTYGVGRANVYSLDSHLPGATYIYPATPNRLTELFIPSSNVSDICCLIKDVTYMENDLAGVNINVDIFENFEPYAGDALHLCKHYYTGNTSSTGSQLPTGVSVHHSDLGTNDKGPSNVLGRRFPTPFQADSTTVAVTCRGIWNGVGGELTHSRDTNSYFFQTPSSVHFSNTNDKAIEIPLAEDPAKTNEPRSVIITDVVTKTEDDATNFKDRQSFKFAVQPNRAIDNEMVTNLNSYVCSKQGGELVPVTTSNCECAPIYRTKLNEDVSQELLQLQLDRSANVYYSEACLTIGGKNYGGGTMLHHVSTLASSQRASTTELHHPAVLTKHVTGGAYSPSDDDFYDQTNYDPTTPTSLTTDTLYTHVGGTSWSIDLNGRQMYKPSLSQAQLDSELDLCLTWGYTSNNKSTVEVCSKANTPDIISIDDDMLYGVLTLRWRMSSGSVNVYSFPSAPLHFGWWAGLVDVDVSIAHLSSSLLLNRDFPLSADNVRSHLMMYNYAEAIKPSDSFRVTIPSNGYVCYTTKPFAAEESDSSTRFESLCTYDTHTAKMGCTSGIASQYTHENTPSGQFEVSALDLASSLQTVVLQNCNPDVELRNRWGSSNDFDTPTNPNNGQYSGKCSTSAAMLLDPINVNYGQVSGNLPAVCKSSDAGSGSGKKGVPHLSTTAVDKTIQDDGMQRVLDAGEGMLEIFGFNAAPIKPNVIVEYEGASIPATLKPSTVGAALPKPVLVLSAGGDGNEQLLTRSFCWSSSSDVGTAPIVPSCLGSEGNSNCKDPDPANSNTVRIPIPHSMQQVRIISCNRQKSPSNHKANFKDLPSSEQSGYVGNSRAASNSAGFFNGVDFNINGDTQKQTCYSHNSTFTFDSFDVENAPTDNAAHNPSQTVHQMCVSAFVAAATPDTSGSNLGVQYYGLNIAASDQNTELMQSSNCTCKHVHSNINTYSDITSAVLHAKTLLLPSNIEHGLMAIKKIGDEYTLIQCAYSRSLLADAETGQSSAPKGATATHPGFLLTKAESNSMCIRKLGATEDTHHIAATQVSSSLHIARSLDNFAPIEQPKDNLACVRLEESGIQSNRHHAGQHYPITAAQLKNAMSVEKHSQSGALGDDYIPTVQVIQAAAGSTVCRDIENNRLATGGSHPTSHQAGYFSTPSTCNKDDHSCIHNGTACRANTGTFEVIAAVNAAIAPTLGQGVEVSAAEATILETPPNWRLDNEDVLSNCVFISSDTVTQGGSSISVARFSCDYMIGTRQSTGGAIYKQPIGSCNKPVNTASGTRFYKTGAPTGARLLGSTDNANVKTCHDHDAEYKAIVSKFITTDTWIDNTHKTVTRLLIEADQFEYNANTDSTYSAFGAFVNSDTDHTVVEPSTSIFFHVTHVADADILEAKLAMNSHIGLTVASCGVESTLVSSKASLGQHTPSWIRTGLHNQRTGHSINKAEMKAYCSDDMKTPCPLGPDGTTRNAPECGFYDLANTKPRRCGVRKIEMCITATNNFVFQSRYKVSPNDPVDSQYYMGHMGKSNTGQVSAWTELDIHTDRNQLYKFGVTGTSSRPIGSTSTFEHQGMDSWAVSSWQQSSLATDGSSRLDNGYRTRQLDVAVTILPLVLDNVIRFDNQNMEPWIDLPGSGQALRALKCPLPSPKVSQLVSAVSTDLTIRHEASFTNTDRQIIHSAQPLSVHISRGYNPTALPSTSAMKSSGTFNDALDSEANNPPFLTGLSDHTQEGAKSVKIVKVRFQSTLTSEGSPVTITPGSKFYMTATLSSQDAGTPVNAGRQRKCTFESLSGHTRASPITQTIEGQQVYTAYSQLDSECLTTPSEALERLYTTDSEYEYLAPKCGTTASSVQKSDSPECVVISDQGIDFALLNDDNNRNDCHHIEDVTFESAVITGIALNVYNNDETNDYSDCQDKSDATFWYLQETGINTGVSKNSNLQMCSRSPSMPQAVCSNTTTQPTELTIHMDGFDTKMSEAVLSDTYATHHTAGYTYSTSTQLGFIHPSFRIQDDACNPEVGGTCVRDSNGQSTEQAVVISKATFESAKLIEFLASDYTAKNSDRNKVSQPHYLEKAPSCDSGEDSEAFEVRERIAMAAICDCKPPHGTKMISAVRDPKLGWPLSSFNKPHHLMQAPQFGHVKVLTGSSGVELSHQAQGASYGSPASGKHLNAYANFMTFHSETFGGERSRDIKHRPNAEIAFIVLCITPRTSLTNKPQGAHTSEHISENKRSGVSTTRSQFCAPHEHLAYLYWGSKNSFEFMTSATKGHFAVPRCSNDRKTAPVGTDQQLGHGEGSHVTGEVYDISPNFAIGSEIVKEDCNRDEQSGHYPATSPHIGTYAETYTNDNTCEKSNATDENYDKYIALVNKRHRSDIHSNDFLVNELGKVRSHPLDMPSNEKYGHVIIQTFQSSDQVYLTSTVMIDAKLLGSIAKAVEIKQYSYMFEVDNAGNRRNEEVVVNTERRLLENNDDQSSKQDSLMHSAVASVPQCQHATGALNSVEILNSTNAACASFVCSNSQLRISAGDSAGLTFELDCVYESDNDSDNNNSTVIWLALVFSLLALVIICSILTYLGYTKAWVKDAEKGLDGLGQGVSTKLDEIRSVL